MKERTLRVLEFTRIREMLAEGALTEAGAEKCRSLEPVDDLASAEALQAETEEVLQAFKEGRKTKGETTTGHWKRPVE